MLQSLHIRNFILIDEVTINFCQAFNVFTGETGSGKSIILNALALILGERLQGDVVRISNNNSVDNSIAYINAEFTLNKLAKNWLIDNDFPINDDQNTVFIKRIIDIAGKNRAYINGMPATLQQLKLFSKLLIEIQSQHIQQKLLQNQYQRHILDAYSQNHNLANEVNNLYHNWKNKIEQLQQAEIQAEKQQENLEYLTWIKNDLTKLNPLKNEWEEIQIEHKKLQNAQDIINNINFIQQYIDDENEGIAKKIRQMQQKIHEITKYDNNLNEISNYIEALNINSTEICNYLDKYLQKIEINPEKLQYLDNRIQQWLTLSRRLKIDNNNLHLELQNIETQLAISNKDTINALKIEIDNCFNSYMEQAKKLSNERKNTAIKLGCNVSIIIQDLAMQNANFSIDIADDKPNEHGIDNITFMLSSNNTTAKPLNKIASGGELSRIALAIIVVVQQKNSMPTLVFDEIDSGISGITAQKIGALLAKYSTSKQILCITHLAQVAAFANQHIMVSKIDNSDSSFAQITVLNQQQKAYEIARLIGGDLINQDTLAHANNLIAYSSTI